MKPNDLINLFIAGFIGLLIGGAAGYFMGYDVGWERAMNGTVVNNGGGAAGGTMPAANTFEECAAEGNPIMESFPRQCRTPDGRLFVEGEPERPDDWTDTPSTPPGPPPSAGKGECVPAGCSGQVCADADEAATIITTCEYREEYACYELTTCERQADGECGWTETAEFSSCLSNPPPLQ